MMARQIAELARAPLQRSPDLAVGECVGPESPACMTRELQRSPDLAVGECRGFFVWNSEVGSLQRSPDLAVGECAPPAR